MCMMCICLVWFWNPGELLHYLARGQLDASVLAARAEQRVERVRRNIQMAFVKLRLQKTNEEPQPASFVRETLNGIACYTRSCWVMTLRKGQGWTRGKIQKYRAKWYREDINSDQNPDYLHTDDCPTQIYRDNSQAIVRIPWNQSVWWNVIRILNIAHMMTSDQFGQGSWTLLTRMLVNSSIELTWILPTGPLSLQYIWDSTVDRGCMVSSRRADLRNTALDWMNLCSCKKSNPAKHASDLSTWLLLSEFLELHASSVLECIEFDEQKAWVRLWVGYKLNTIEL